MAIVATAKFLIGTGGTVTPVPFRFAIELPDSVGVVNGLGIKLALSRDGSRLVVGVKEGRNALYLRRPDDIQAKLVPGTDSAFNPSFSPDGQWLLFQSGSRLLKLHLGQRKSRSLDFARDDKNDGAMRDLHSTNVRSGEDIAVSKDGGTEPAWSADGTTLYFRGLMHMMSASVAERGAIVVGTPVALFPDTFRLSVAHTGSDVFPAHHPVIIPLLRRLL